MWDGQVCSYVIDSLSNDKNNSTFTFVILTNASGFDMASKKKPARFDSGRKHEST